MREAQPDPATLATLGWSAHWDAALASMPPADPPPVCARVVAQHRGRWTCAYTAGTVAADLPGRFRKLDSLALPSVGDWVRIHIRADGATILDILPRSSTMTRLVAGGTTDVQVIAANVDTVLIVVPLDVLPNARRLERQLSTVWESGAMPVIVATKVDLCNDRVAAEEVLRATAVGVDVLVISNTTGEGIEGVEALAEPGRTLALLGTSGAGKSTLANRLIGHEAMAVKEVDASGKGRHTTSHRQLLVLPTGALLIDTPGMRELGLWVAEEGGVASTFADVEDVAASCRFSNCGHSGDVGCALPAAIADGTLDAARVEAWRSLNAEQAWVERRHDARLQAEEKRKWAALNREGRERSRP